MKIFTQRTLCSIVFASLVTTQLSGMLSNLKPDGKVKNILLKKNVCIEHETIQSPHSKKDTFKITTIQQKFTDLSFSLIKKEWKKNKDQEEETESDKKSKFNRKKTALMAGAVGAVGFFLYKNRDKFIPEVHCAGYPDLKPLNPGSPNGNKDKKLGIVQQIANEVIKGAAPGLYQFLTGAAVIIFGYKMTKDRVKEKEEPIAYDTNSFDSRYYKCISEKHGEKIFIDIRTGLPVSLAMTNTPNYSQPTPIIPPVQSKSGNAVVVTPPAKSTPSQDFQDYFNKNAQILPHSPKTNGPKDPNSRKVEIIDGLPGLKDDNDINPDKLTPEIVSKEGLSFDDVYDTLRSLGGNLVVGARELFWDAVAKRAWHSLYNSGSRLQQANRNLLLGIPDETVVDPKERYPAWITRKIGENFNYAFDNTVDFAKDVALLPLDIALYRKCLYWEWKSYEHCGNRFYRIEYRNIKDKYAPELEKIKDIDERIKYVKNHEDLSESTKKSTLDLLEGMKKLNEKIEYNRKTAKDILSSNLSDEHKKHLLKLLAENNKE